AFMHKRGSGCYTTLTYWVFIVVWKLFVIRGLLVLIYCAAAWSFLSGQGHDFVMLLAVVEAAVAAFFALSSFIGSISASTQQAYSILQAVLAFFIIAGGMLINFSSVPRTIRWIESFSIVRYGYESLLITLFHGRSFDCDPTVNAECFTGDGYLHYQGFSIDKRAADIRTLAYITVGLLLLSLAAMTLTRLPLDHGRPRASFWSQARNAVARALHAIARLCQGPRYEDIP
ncbi:ABC transporter, partial [Diplonema papillatum]